MIKLIKHFINWINKPKSGLFKMGNGRTVNDKN